MTSDTRSENPILPGSQDSQSLDDNPSSDVEMVVESVTNSKGLSDVIKFFYF